MPPFCLKIVDTVYDIAALVAVALIRFSFCVGTTIGGLHAGIRAGYQDGYRLVQARFRS